MYSDLMLCTASNTFTILAYSALWFSGISRHIKLYLALLRHIHAYWDIIKASGFWIRLYLNKYSVTCRVTSRYIVWYIFRTLSIIVNSDIITHMHVLFRYIQPHYGIFKTLFNSSIFRTLPYSESWDRTRDIFRTCQEVYWPI